MTPDEFRAIREGIGLSRTEWGVALGYGGRSNVARLEAGESPITPTAARLAEMYRRFGVPADLPQLTPPKRSPRLSPAERGARIRAGLARKPRRPRSAEEKAKISAALVGRPLSAEHRQKLRAAKLGRRLSPAHRAKLSAKAMGRKLTVEERAKISAAKLGKKQSPEIKSRLAAMRALKKLKREAKEKRRVAAQEKRRQARLTSQAVEDFDPQ